MLERSTTASAWTINRLVALIIGVVFLVIGIVGLIFDTTAGSLLAFQVDLIHNLVHLVTGIVALAAVFGGWSRRFNQVFGIIYLLVGIAGLIPSLYFGGNLLGIMAVNGADNVLHLVVGAIAAAVGFFVNESTSVTGRGDPMVRP